MIRLLVAGPDMGMEFGWRLMRWQGHIRHMSKIFDQTVVLTSDEYWPLYADFAVRWPTIGTADRWRYNDVDTAYVQPCKAICRAADLQQQFVNYSLRAIPSVLKGAIVCHARMDSRQVLGKRNWPAKFWDRLATEILQSKTDYNTLRLTPVFIGSADASYCPDIRGVWDFRNKRLDQIFGTLDNALLCCGPSSGPMHLASLCKCPHVAWSDDSVWDLGSCKGTNRQRYETEWNPFNTRVRFIDHEGWQPRYETVRDTVFSMVENLEQKL